MLEANAQSSAPLSIDGALRFLRQKFATTRTTKTAVAVAISKASAGDESLTVFIERLRQIITNAQQPAWLKLLSRHNKQRALTVVERLCNDLYALVELRNTAAKAMPDITPPAAADATRHSNARSKKFKVVGGTESAVPH